MCSRNQNNEIQSDEKNDQLRIDNFKSLNNINITLSDTNPRATLDPKNSKRGESPK